MTYIDEWRKATIRLSDPVDEGRGGGDRPRFDWMGVDGDLRRHGKPHPHRNGAVTDHWDPPATPKRGMTAKELAQHQAQLATYARGRILGIGAEQYDDKTEQRFEGMTVDELLTATREEIADIINYVTMLDILIGRLLVGVRSV